MGKAIWDRSLFSKSMKPNRTKLNVDTLEGYIEKTITEAKKSSMFKKKKSFSPSSFSYYGRCPRYWSIAFNGATFEDAPDALGIFAMEFGTKYGDELEKRLLDAGIAAQTQLSVENVDPPIFGYLDFIGVIDEEEYVADIKTVGSSKFDKIVSTGKAPDANIIQVLLYMRILRYTSGCLIYVDRDTGRMVIVPISISEKNKAYVEYIYQWMRDVKDWADNKEELPARAFTKSNYICKMCPVSNTCDKFDPNKNTGPGPLDIDIQNWVEPE